MYACLHLPLMISYSSGLPVLELGGGNFLKSARSPGLLFSPGLYPMGLFQADL